MATSLVPSDGADCLDRLGKNFQLAAEVVGALSKAGIANLEEFRFFFDAEAKVEPWLGKIQLGAEAQIQAARLRRAWHSVSLCYKTAEQDRSRVAIEDLDSLLGDTDKHKFPTEVYPSDAAVSRASREMSKRLLCVTAVWKVKTLQWQLGTASKKRKLGEGLWTEEPDDEQPGHQDWETYLDRLFTLLLAYALGGVKALDNAPPAKEEDVLGADTTGRGDALPRESPAHIGQPALCQPTGMAPAAGHRGEGRLGEPIQGVQPDAGPGHQGHIRGAGRPLGPDRTSFVGAQGAPTHLPSQRRRGANPRWRSRSQGERSHAP